jgi:hypothetical protein
MAGRLMAFKPSGRSVTERLGLSADTRLLTLGVPVPGWERWPGVRVDGDAEVVVVGCGVASDVERWARTAWRARRDGGRLWFAYRKGRREFTRAQVGAALEGQGLGLTWFRQIAIDGTWSAIWFKHRSEFKTLDR